MIACFADLATVENDDLVGVADRGETVRDDESGSALHELYHCFLDTHFRTGVDAGGRLVENEDLGIGKNGSRDGEELTLTVTDIAARFGQHGLIALGHTIDEAVCVRHCGCLVKLVIGGVGLTIADIGFDRVRKENGVLQNDRDIVSERILCDILDILAVEKDLAGVDLVETGEQIDDGRFTRARLADDGDLLSGLDLEIEILQNGLAGNVGEVDVTEGESAGHLFGTEIYLAFVDLGGFVHDLKHTLRAADCVEDRGELVRDLVDRTGELLGELDEKEDDCDLDAAVQREDDARDDDQEKADVVDDVHERTHNAAEDLRLDAGFAKLAADLAEALLRDLLAGERHDRAVAHDAFLNLCVELTEKLLLSDEIAAHALGDERGHENGDGNGDDADERHFPASVEHDGERADDDDQAGNERGNGLGDGIRDIFDIVGHTAHDVAVGMVVDVFDGELFDAAEKVVTHRADRSLRELCGKAALREGEARGKHVEDRDQRKDLAHGFEIHAGKAVDEFHITALHGVGREIVQRFGLKNGGSESDERGNDNADDHDEEQNLAFSDIGEQSSDGLLHIFRFFNRHGTASAAHAGSAGHHAAGTAGSALIGSVLIVIQCFHLVSAGIHRCRGRCRWFQGDPHACRRRQPYRRRGR